MRVVVTGADGFVGAYLCGALHARGDEIIPLVLRPCDGLVVRLDQDPTISHRLSIPTHVVELPDRPRVAEILRHTEPDAVVHLAAVSAVPDSSRAPDYARRVNVEGTADVAGAIAEHCPATRLLFTSSCLVYGPTPIEAQPVDETTPVHPNNEYGRTKLEAEHAIVSLRDRFETAPIIVRPFNQFGPGQSPSFVLSSFARQIERIRVGLEPPVLRTGNLEVRREFLDVRDVVAAYLGLLDAEAADGVFTVASGRPQLLRGLLERLSQIAGVEFEVETDPARLRPNDLEVLSGSARRLEQTTGWKPHRTIDESLRALLQYWRNRIAVEQRGTGDAVR
ncbi:MAG: GDP-mannose 4,6-dehydratase [Planctomycetes bacterium]|nr:GDP-mannose 4,6-dehydratase [Planctomycetota bacterium]